MEDYENFYHDKYGYCYYSLEPNKVPAIFNLYVEPEYRGKGHGRRLLKIVISTIRQYDYQGPIEIEADPREGSIERSSLVALYQNMGLTVI